MINFRHYKPNGRYNEPLWGWSFSPSKRQPTLDFYVGNHVFVFFWRRGE
jgi:hypothetical protein